MKFAIYEYSHRITSYLFCEFSIDMYLIESNMVSVFFLYNLSLNIYTLFQILLIINTCNCNVLFLVCTSSVLIALFLVGLVMTYMSGNTGIKIFLLFQ